MFKNQTFDDDTNFFEIRKLIPYNLRVRKDNKKIFSYTNI